MYEQSKGGSLNCGNKLELYQNVRKHATEGKYMRGKGRECVRAVQNAQRCSGQAGRDKLYLIKPLKR